MPMTIKDLSQLYYLRREIEQEEQRIRALRERATSITSSVSGMPHGGGIADKTAIAADIADCEMLIAAKLNESIVMYRQLMAYINDIDDSLTRQIFKARFVDGLKWEQVADRCGGSVASAKMTVRRYLQKDVTHVTF